MPRLVLLVALSFAVATPALARKGADASAPPTEAMLEVRQLRKAIVAQELADALQLDAEQIEVVTGLIAEAEAMRAEHRARREAAAPKVADALEQYLAEVRRDGQASERTAAALDRARQAARGDGGGKEFRQEVRETLLETLSEQQKQTLMAFEPSLRPEPDEERVAERRAKFEAKAAERGATPEQRERFAQRKQKQQARKRMRRLVREVLLSPEMAEALQ